MDSKKELAKLLASAKRITVITGADISAESGLPDFRRADGPYSKVKRSVLSRWLFKHSLSCFYKTMGPMYKPIMVARPNMAHKALATLGKLMQVDIITENVDGLHQAAGSDNVFELHGSLCSLTCQKCGKQVEVTDDIAMVASAGNVPKHSCGGTLKPDIVLFGDKCDESTYDLAMLSILNAEVILICGTSLCVNTPMELLKTHVEGVVRIPSLEECAAVELLKWRVTGTLLAVVNNEQVHVLDEIADVVVHGALDETLPEICAETIRLCISNR